MTTELLEFLDVEANALALTDHVISYNWRQLIDRCVQASNLFTNDAHGSRVGVITTNASESLVAHFGAMLAGIPSVAINARLHPAEIAYILKDSDCSLVVAGSELADVARAAAELAESRVLLWGQVESSEDESWESMLRQSASEWRTADRSSQPMILYTSGTSGFPKGTHVQWSHQTGTDVLEYLAGIREIMSTIPHGPHLVVGPLHHHGPLMSLRSLVAGRPVVVEPRFTPERALTSIQNFRVTSSVMVPTHLSRIIAMPESQRTAFDASSLKRIVLTGASCPPQVKRAVIDWLGPVVVEAYGGSESGTVCQITSEEWLQRPGSVGRTLPRFEALVVDEEELRLPSGVPGRLYFKDHSRRGIAYINDPAKTAAAHLSPGTFTLGDVGFVDSEGYVYLTDRAIDMIITGGANIYPAEAERVLTSHPAVLDVAVIGLPHEDLGEQAVALIVLKPGMATLSSTDLDSFCKSELATQKCPRSYRFVESLGRDLMGKLNKRALRIEYAPLSTPFGKSNT